MVTKPKSEATEAALKELKEQKKAGKKANIAAPRGNAGASVPKVQRSAAASSRGSSGR